MSRDDVPTRDRFRVFRPTPTRWMDNDVYGHLNNVVYYSLFDTAVNGWLLDAVGEDIRVQPQIGIVAETSCRFLASTGFPDRLEVGVGLERQGRSSVTYELAVFVEGAESPSAIGRFVHVYVDAVTRRPVPIPSAVATALASL